MTRDRSLDDFLGGGEGDGRTSDGREDDESDDDATAETAEPTDSEGEPNSERAASEASRGDDDSVSEPDAVAESGADPDSTAPTAEDVDPAVGTYRWHPDGVACAACGETVDRLWLDDGRQVCGDCKEW